MGLLVTPVAGATPSMDIETVPADHCTSPLPLGICAVGHDPGPSPGIGDDTVHVQAVVARASATVPSSVLPPMSISADYENTTIEHSAFIEAEHLASYLNSSLPPSAKGWVEVRNGTAATGMQGIWLSASPYRWVPFADATWRMGIPLLVYVPGWVERERVRPLGDGGTGEPFDSDVFLELAAEAAAYCVVDEALGLGQPCAQRASLGQALAETLESNLPNVTMNSGVQRASFSVGKHGAPAIGQGMALDVHGSSSQASPGPSEVAITPRTGAPAASLGAPSLPPGAAPRPTPADATTPWGATLRPAGDHRAWAIIAALGAIAAALLYNRILGQRSLEHEKRVRLLELAKAHPGVLIGQAAKRLQVSYHCADHHASVLARCGQVDIVQAGRMRAIYPSGSIPVAHRAALVWLRRGPQAEALRLVLQHPGRRSSELASLMGCKKSSAFEKLRNLRKHGLVRVDALAGYHITEQGCQALGLLERLPALQVHPAPRAEAPTGPSEAT